MVLRLFIFSIISFLSLQHAFAQEDYIRKSIFFPGGSYAIDDYQSGKLRDFLDSIPNIRQFEITIHSHTDNIGGRSYNEWLSQMRSESTIRELINNAVDEKSIAIKDFGQFNPLYDNTTANGRRLNRRVDIILWPIAF